MVWTQSLEYNQRAVHLLDGIPPLYFLVTYLSFLSFSLVFRLDSIPFSALSSVFFFTSGSRFVKSCFTMWNVTPKTRLVTCRFSRSKHNTFVQHLPPLSGGVWPFCSIYHPSFTSYNDSCHKNVEQERQGIALWRHYRLYHFRRNRHFE